MATRNSLPVNLRPGYKMQKKEKDILENGFNGTRDRAMSRGKSATAGTTTAGKETMKGRRFEQGAQAAVKLYNQYKENQSKKASTTSTTTEKKKDPNRFKAISDRANAKRTDEQKAAIQKNNDRIYWQNKERMNNSGSYNAMMQSRTKGAMQKASDKNLYGGDNISNIKGEKKSNTYKQYEKAFGKKKGR